jgi:flagellar export protein FliJ
MSDLRPLIRFHRWRLDEKQRALAELRNQLDQLRYNAECLEQTILAEQEAARQSFEASLWYPNFARLANSRREQFAQAIADMEMQIAAAIEDIGTTFQEVKRYELAQEERLRQARAEELRKENIMLDETAITGFFRRRKENEQNGG